MKIAFHFKCTGDEPGNYIIPYEKEIILALKNHPQIAVSIKWFSGDLIFYDMASDRTENENGYTLSPNKDKFVYVVNKWLNPGTPIYQRINEERLRDAISGIIFCIGAENLDIDAINFIHERLLRFDKYIGALEIDEASEIHWILYSLQIGPRYRQVNDKLYIFWDGISEDSKRDDLIDEWKNKGFSCVEHESLNGRHTLFDGYHNFEHARRVAAFKKRTGYLLGYLVDDLISKLQDSCVEIGNKFWAALNSFERAETIEEYAHVATSCRRIIEYVTDNIFPPTDGDHNGFKLGKNNYRNRLLAFADRERKSDTNIDLISVSTKMLAEQLEKLNNLQNKGVHSEVMREEARRCLIRTIMILDDILALKISQFPIKTKLDTSWLSKGMG